MPALHVAMDDPKANGNGHTTLDASLLRQELVAQKDTYLRLMADFDNYRKRTRRDAAVQAASEKEAFIRELLPVLDNLERALVHDRTLSAASLRQGVEMTRQQLVRLLQSHGIVASEDLGQIFNPHHHEALSVRSDPHKPDQQILEVLQRGYHCGDKVFRPAQVIVNDPGHNPET
jgi:molecular chaperone GrpE